MPTAVLATAEVDPAATPVRRPATCPKKFCHDSPIPSSLAESLVISPTKAPVEAAIAEEPASSAAVPTPLAPSMDIIGSPATALAPIPAYFSNRPEGATFV